MGLIRRLEEEEVPYAAYGMPPIVYRYLIVFQADRRRLLLEELPARTIPTIRYTVVTVLNLP